ncbi:MAG: cell wall-binding repeat-containing protein, partial [Coriobacteriia bacterium]|nr:cell wall-binding repeat-containing protein [Coriobacteriia bacterium]
ATVTYRTRFMSLEGPTVWPEGITVTEIEGENRIATAIETAEAAFPDGADTVLIATAYNWPDALGGAALAGAVDGPILLTDPNTLPAAVAEEIGRLGASRAIILGGTGAVAPAVESALGTLLGSQSVKRIAGTDRYATARAIAAEAVARLSSRPEGYSGTAFVATGATFPDALGASPLAAANGWPIYLVDPRGVDSATISAMKAAGVKHTIVLGGTGAVSADAQAAIAGGVSCSTERIAGSTRYDTAAKVAAYGVTECGMYWSGVAIATGMNFPDALAGGVLQGRSGAVMLLTPSCSLDPAAGGTLGENKAAISEVRFLGGTGALSVVVRDAVADALR